MNINYHLCFLIFCLCYDRISGYLNVRLEDTLCANAFNNSTITLLEENESAAIFTQQWNKTVSSSSPLYDCEFLLLSSKDAYRIPRGTYVTINHLNMRKNPLTQECMDYIQFRNAFSKPGKRFCGDTDVDGVTDDLLFENVDRNVYVKIHIDNSTEIKEPLELRMVVTAHSQCNNKEDFLCDPKLPYSCISRHFVGDNITNCLAPCRDESQCFKEVKTLKLSKTAKSLLNDANSLIQFRSTDGVDSSCISAKFLEESLQKNTETLQSYLKKNEDTILNRLDEKFQISVVPPPPINFQRNNDNCITSEILESTLKRHMDDLLKAMDDIVQPITKIIELVISQYKNDFYQLNEKVETLKNAFQMSTSRGAYQSY